MKRFVPLGILACALVEVVEGQAIRAVVDGGPLQFLSWVEPAGDIDGDGVTDLLFVALHESGTTDPGPFWIVSGATLLPIGAPIAAEPGSNADSPVRAIGDFDGDGTPDFARLNEQPTSQTWDIQFFSGATRAEFLRIPIYPDLIWGAEISRHGDHNGDGFDDVVIVRRGQYLTHNFLASILHGPLGAETTVLGTGSPWMHFAPAGDIDGDGLDDFVRFMQHDLLPGATNPPQAVGAINRAIPAGASNLLAGAWGDVAEGFGHHATVVSDLNGDGRRDLAVGVPGRIDVTCCDPGRVEFFTSTGFNLPPIAILHGVDDGSSASHGGFGARLDGSGDIDGDGITDLLVSAPGSNGQQGYVDAYKLPDMTLLWRVRPMGPLDIQVRTPVFLGDLDGDGASEWAVVDPWASYGGPLAGRVWIYSGGMGEASSFCPASLNSTGVAAELRWLGPLSASHAEAAYELIGAPPHSLALAFFGNEGPPRPAGDGTLCLGGSLHRLPVLSLDANGYGRQNVTTAVAAAGHSAWTAGSTWALQAVYREALGAGGSGFNATNGWRLTLLP